MRENNRALLGLVLLPLLLTGCGAGRAPEDMAMDPIAESYVHLTLALGQHDQDYVDAYLGPEEWRAEAEASPLELPTIRERAQDLIEQLEAIEPPADDENVQLRHAHLLRTLESLAARVDLLSGVPMTFDQESLALYDAVAPTYPEEHFQGVVAKLDALLVGEGTVTERYEAFRSRFIIPPDQLDAVFQAAIQACRERTQEWIDLPAEESFELEYVQDKSWSGYNWYQGGYQSLIQINTDLPIYIDRALDLACHEGYPGHHTYNVLLERELVRDQGWMEFSVYPLFSPRSLIAEGSANFGIEVAFPADQRVRFERDVLFPLAGIEPNLAATYYGIYDLAQGLDFAGNEAARRYLDGDIDAEEAIDWLTAYALMSPERAAQRVRFIDQYRSYVINYNLGQELVRKYIEGRGGTPDHPDTRWAEFTMLLSQPALPSRLQ